jgi:hypothetical protein
VISERITVRFDQLPLRYATVIGPRLGSYAQGGLRIERTGDVGDQLGEAVYKMSTQILAGKILGDTQEFTFGIPATWWQHWKQDHAASWYASWLVRRRPVKTRLLRSAVDFSRYAAYPLADLPVAPPDEFGYPVIYEMMRLREPAEPGIEQVFKDNPRAVFISRMRAERAIMETALQLATGGDVFRQPGFSSRQYGFDAHDLRLIFDALERLGVNVSQLITETALESRDLPV